MTPPRKRIVNPHDPNIPLVIAISRAKSLSEALESLRSARVAALDTMGPLPAHVVLHRRQCAATCAACPHVRFSIQGVSGRRETLALSAILKKNKKMRDLLQAEDRFSRLAARAAVRISHDRFRASAPFTPIPYHVFAWKALSINSRVLDLHRSLVQWNVQNNRACNGRITSQGALGFRIHHQPRSGILRPRWAVWTRGNMGQWIGAKTAKPTYGAPFSRPDQHFSIPVRMTASVINRTGNHPYREAYLQWEKRRAEIVRDIASLSAESRSLGQLHALVSRFSVVSDLRGLIKRSSSRRKNTKRDHPVTP